MLETIKALASHELIKVKILESCLLNRNEAATELAVASGAEVAQILGRTILLYKRGEEPKIELPQ
jgi:RNA-binding protein